MSIFVRVPTKKVGKSEQKFAAWRKPSTGKEPGMRIKYPFLFLQHIISHHVDLNPRT
jgi:hypothetical protein